MRVLVSRPDKIGDVILALHAVKQLKALLPKVEVYLHVSSYTAPLVRNVKFVDGCVLLGEDLAPYHFDAVVDLIAKSHTARWYQAASIRQRIGNAARWFFYRYNRRRYIRRSHAMMKEAEYNWQLTSLLDPTLEHTPLRTVLETQDFIEVTPFIDLKNYYVLMPGISVSARRWSLPYWQRLAELLVKRTNLPVVFLLGPAEQDLQQELLPLTTSNSLVSFRSFHNFPALIGFLQGARAYVGPSTGITHLASACRVPGVGLYPEANSMHPNRWMPFQSSLKILALNEQLTAEKIVKILLNDCDGSHKPYERESISAFIVCCNEENNIRRALESITWCDEILIVDSGSTDRTLDICREYTDRIIERPWQGHSEQKQFALDNCRHNWVLNIDSDEEVSMELKGSILALLSQPTERLEQVAGYRICRIVRYLSRWWDQGGWFPEYRLRLMQRKLAHWGGVNPHEKAIVNGRVKKLRGFIYHYTYRDIAHQIETLNAHSSNAAQHLYSLGRRASLWALIMHPIFRFIKFYFYKRGLLEGRHGFVIGCIEACYTFFKYAKLWELECQHKAAVNKDSDGLAEITKENTGVAKGHSATTKSE